MPASLSVRALLAFAAALAGLLLALLTGAPWPSAILALAGGALAALVLGRKNAAPAKPAPATDPKPIMALPELQPVLDALDQPLLIVRRGRVLAANGAARSTLGAHIVGSDVRLAIRHPAAAERLARGEPDVGDDRPIELIGLGEQNRRWEMKVAALGDDDVLVALTDTSAIHAAEQMRSDFVANASHELRTPLATLLGFLETLQDSQTAENEEKRSRFLRIMFGEAKRMQRLIEDLMSLSRIEAKRFSMPRETVALQPLVQESWSHLQPLRERKQMTLIVDEPPQAAIVAGDRPQLLQMVMNLMENAVRYGREKTSITVTIADDHAEMIRISIADRGDGVAPEHLPHLTRRFYRVDASRSRAEGGTGLGLAIVKHIVERHRGRLDISSKVGEGTTVTILLPRAAASALAVTKESLNRHENRAKSN